MEEEKAAAYYNELTEKGSGAARFKQGLGFSRSGDNDRPPPARGSAFMSNFVKASSESESRKVEKECEIERIQDKLKKKESISSIDGRGNKNRVRVSDRRRSRSRSRERVSRRRYRSRSRDRDRRERSRSRSLSPRGRKLERRRRRRSNSYEERKDWSNKSRRSKSPRERERRRKSEGKGVDKEGGGVVDYAKLIHGYHNMTPAEKLKAKIKLQLSHTAEKDEKMGSGSQSQWGRFHFDKDAPLEDEVLEAADDDAAVSKRIGQSFRFASLEGKREDEVRNAHDEAMFGIPTPAPQPSQTSESDDETENEDTHTETDDTDANPASSLLSEKVLSRQQGSWRDRAHRKVG